MLDKLALGAVDGTVSVMGDELGWSDDRRQAERQQASEFIKTFGL